MIEAISPRDLSIEEVSETSDIVLSDTPVAKILITDRSKRALIIELSILSITSSDHPRSYSGRMKRAVLFSAPMIVPISSTQQRQILKNSKWRFYHKSSPEDFAEGINSFMPYNVEPALALGKLLIKEWNKKDDVVVLLPYNNDSSLILTSPFDVHNYANRDERLKIEMKSSTAHQLVALVSTFAMLYPEYVSDDIAKRYPQYTASKLYLAVSMAFNALTRTTRSFPDMLSGDINEQLKKI